MQRGAYGSAHRRRQSRRIGRRGLLVPALGLRLERKWWRRRQVCSDSEARSRRQGRCLAGTQLPETSVERGEGWLAGQPAAMLGSSTDWRGRHLGILCKHVRRRRDRRLRRARAVAVHGEGTRIQGGRMRDGGENGGNRVRENHQMAFTSRRNVAGPRPSTASSTLFPPVREGTAQWSRCSRASPLIRILALHVCLQK